MPDMNLMVVFLCCCVEGNARVFQTLVLHSLREWMRMSLSSENREDEIIKKEG
jgi:hypothetical protein